MESYIRNAVHVSGKSPVLLDSYLTDAIEVDVDAISDGKNVHIAGIMEHIEEAGVHSGDSACSLPPYSLRQATIGELEKQTKTLALSLNVVGLMNIQFAIKDDTIFVLEVNPRASRTVPFVAKAVNSPIAAIAARVMAGEPLTNFELKSSNTKHFCVKEAVLPFNKFPEESVFLSPEMKSTGEVMGISNTMGESFRRASISAGNTIPKSGKVFISVNDADKLDIIRTARDLTELGFDIIATIGTTKELKRNGINVDSVFKVGEGRPNIVDLSLIHI